MTEVTLVSAPKRTTDAQEQAVALLTKCTTFVPSQGSEIAGRYRLLHWLGDGGMGVVWAAEHIESGAPVAIKFIRDQLASPQLHRRFVREARAASAVRHPNVVQIREVLELTDGSPVLVMEFLVGESLDQMLSRQKEIPLREVASIMQQVVSAVGSAHAIGIIHRDLKPENIFLVPGEGGSLLVKVLDFGIAKLTAAHGEAARTDIALTDSGAILGTPFYMAPEQVFGDRDLDHRADIRAIGLIIYECLTGILPTRAETVGQILKLILTRSICPIEQLAPDLPADVAALVNRMVSRRKDQRPYDLLCVSEVLRRHTPASAPSFGPPATRGQDAASSPSSETSVQIRALPIESPARERGKRVPRRNWVGAALLVGVATASGASIGGWPSHNEHAHGQAPPAPATTATVLGPELASEPPPPIPVVRLSVRATPTHAEVLVDGERVSNPFHRLLTQDDKPHRVVIVAKGYEPRSTVIHYRRDVDIDVELTRSSTPPSREARNPPPPPPGPPTLDPWPGRDATE